MPKEKELLPKERGLVPKGRELVPKERGLVPDGREEVTGGCRKAQKGHGWIMR